MQSQGSDFFGSLSLEEVNILAGVKITFSPVPPKNGYVVSIIHLMRMCVCPSVSFNHKCIQRLIKTLYQKRRMLKGTAMMQAYNPVTRRACKCQIRHEATR